jgi:hypothetical protein
MTVLRRHRLGLLAIVLAGLAAVLVLFAADTRAWQSAVRRDDIRFRALPDHNALWSPSTILPGDPAGAVLSTGDTLEWRRALRSFWSTRIGANPQAQVDLPRLRATAQGHLLHLISTGKTAQERSAAANLLGVLIITTPLSAGNQQAQLQVIKQAIAYYQQAVALDPGNNEAKENLELLLRATRPGKGPLGRDAHAGFGFGRGHGETIVGNGY